VRAGVGGGRWWRGVLCCGGGGDGGGDGGYGVWIGGGFWVLWVVVVGDGAVMSWIAGSWIVRGPTVGNGPDERG